jgi:hypothetical protein
MIEAAARFYVYVLEPAGLVLLLLLGVVAVLWIFSAIRNPQAKENILNGIMKLIFGLIKGTLNIIGIVLKKLITLLINIMQVIFAAFRDFFKSKI